MQRESDDDSSAEVAAEAAAASLDDLRQLVHAAERERGICLLESFEHFDRRGQVGGPTQSLSSKQLRSCRLLAKNPVPCGFHTTNQQWQRRDLADGASH